MDTLKPRPSPCSSCPYRRDVPSGIWDASEYARLPLYDGETWGQPTGVFLCHQADGFICAGWCGCHDMQENLALRIAPHLDPDIDVQACLDYTSPVPLFASGAEAAEHGMRDIEDLSPEAGEVIDRLLVTRKRKTKTRRTRGVK